jgi:predicted amidophosphoribosyltransferase
MSSISAEEVIDAKRKRRGPSVPRCIVCKEPVPRSDDYCPSCWAKELGLGPAQVSLGQIIKETAIVVKRAY